MEFYIREQSHPLGIKWFRNKSRYDTMTDSKFLNKNTILCANRESGKFYIVKFTVNPYSAKIVFTTDTSFGGQLKYIDLFTVKDDLIYFVSLDNTIGILKIEGDTLIKKELITVPANYYFHSITFHPSKPNIVYLGSALFNPRLVIYDIQKREVLQDVILLNMKNLLIKDVKFLSETTIVVSGTGGLISVNNKNHSYNSGIGVYTAETFECLDYVEFGNAHTDGLAIDGDKNIYIVCQGDQPENILKFKFEADKLVRQKGYTLPQFPHGIDVNYGLLTCSCLKNSSICLLPIEF
jgi:hypothetical protein